MEEWLCFLFNMKTAFLLHYSPKLNIHFGSKHIAPEKYLMNRD